MARQTSPATSALRPRWRLRPARLLGDSFSYLVLIAASLTFLYPIIWLFSASVKPNTLIYQAPLQLLPSELEFKAYNEILRTTPMWRYALNSILYALVGSLVTLAFSVLAAYGLSRHVFRGKRLFLTLILVVQLVPGLVRIIPVFVMMNALSLVNTRHGIILLYGAGGIAYGMWFLKGFFDSIPKELDEAAWIDGASKLRTIWQIILPSLVPGLAALLILQFIGHWNDFTTAVVLLRQPALRPLTVATFNLIGPDEADFRLLAAACLMNVVPVILVFSVLQRYLVSGLSAGAIKG
jgi:multiple sugar transport system permease protein